MTTWTDKTTIETSWNETTVLTQVIEFIDNEEIFDYKLTNINGQYKRLWEDSGTIETSWRE